MGKIIGVAGQLANGKDVLSDYLCISLNKKSGNWKRGAFATPLKQVFKDSFGVDDAFIEKWKRSTDIPPGMLMNVRKGLQFIGDGFRKIKSNIWIEMALREDRDVILSDSRYWNEAKEIRQRDGLAIVIYRQGFLNDDPNESESQIKEVVLFCLENLGEGPIPNFQILKEKFGDKCPDSIQHYNYFIINDKEIEDLYKKIDSELVPYVEKFFI